MSPKIAILPTLVVALLGLAASPAAAQRAEAPDEQALYASGPNGRFLLDGEWLFRLDPTNVGLSQGFAGQTGRSGWTPTTVPNAWNATDQSAASYTGTVGWYRKDFTLPSARAALDWVTRFESVNYRSQVFLNGAPIAANTGAYLPFEVRLPPRLIKRDSINRLVVRVENKRLPTDFPPATTSVEGLPTGGWWNYGGLLREVYLRRVDRIDFADVVVRPELPCATCPASVEFSFVVRNLATSATRTKLTGRFGDRNVDFGTVAVGPSSSTVVTKRLGVSQPRLWSPEAPNLYDVELRATSAAKSNAPLQRYRLKTGIRSVKVVDGQWLLNGRRLNVRGVGLHEDDPALGFAITNEIRAREVAETVELGATMLRAHYPLHPYTHELADAQGIMIWSEIPVYAVKTDALAQREVRRLAAFELERNIRVNQNHPSVVVWSVGNELSSRPGPVQGYYIAQAARRAKALDPTRPVGYAVAGTPGVGCQTEYAPLDIIGVNEYFGWYPGPNGLVADRELLSPYLDAVHACYPDKAVVVSEFGAEANRSGPIEEKGTFEFQSDFASYHLGVFATKPWLAGAMYWALEEFRVRPDWNGGNPRPSPPVHQKGLIAVDGTRKPAFAEVQRLFRATDQHEG